MEKYLLKQAVIRKLSFKMPGFKGIADAVKGSFQNNTAKILDKRMAGLNTQLDKFRPGRHLHGGKIPKQVAHPSQLQAAPNQTPLPAPNQTPLPAPNQTPVSISDRPAYNFGGTAVERAQRLGMNSGMGAPSIGLREGLKTVGQKARHPIEAIKEGIRNSKEPMERAIAGQRNRRARFTKEMERFNKNPHMDKQRVMENAPASFGEKAMNVGRDPLQDQGSILSQFARENPVARTAVSAGKMAGKGAVAAGKGAANSQTVKNLIERNRHIRYPIPSANIGQAAGNPWMQAIIKDLADPAAPVIPLPANTIAEVLAWVKGLKGHA